MKNYTTPRMTRDGQLKGISYSANESPKWSLVALGAFIGFILGALI